MKLLVVLNHLFWFLKTDTTFLTTIFWLAVCDPHCDLFDVNELRPSQNYLILFLVNLNESVSHVSLNESVPEAEI